jgi:hypothetical protein
LVTVTRWVFDSSCWYLRTIHCFNVSIDAYLVLVKLMTAALFGKKEDPNIAALVPLFDIFIDQESHLHWDLDTDKLFVNGEPVTFTKYFGRSNVFGKVTDQMAANYFLMRNYLIAHKNIKRFNQDYERETPTKASNLILAKKLGLRIPKTVIGTEIDEEEAIVKPLTGGFHVEQRSKALFTAILQKRIRGTNRRLFVVGNEIFSFEIQTTELDYRKDPDLRIALAEFDEKTIKYSKKLADEMRLSYAALDFVENYFLEINSMPMFVAFDQITSGKLAKAIRASLD